jgi:predicted dehydrogenase
MIFLIAGLGSIGHRHFRNLRLLGEQDIVLFRTHRSSLPDDELAGFPVETDLHHALCPPPGSGLSKPDAVIISNPTALHMEVAIPAAEAGCAIFLEKPISDSPARLDELAAAAERSGSRIMVGFQFRFHPTLRKAVQLIGEGVIGKVLTAHVHWGEYLPNWHPWEDYRQSYAARADLGGGVIRTLIHPLDYVRWLVGDVDQLWSINGHISPLELDVEDIAEVGLHFTKGAIGGIHINYFQRPTQHRLEIVGTGGTLRWDNADGILHLFRIPEEFGRWSVEPSAPVMEEFTPPKGFVRNDMFVEQMRHFIAVVRRETMPICTLEDGWQALNMALAAETASREMKMQIIPRVRM